MADNMVNIGKIASAVGIKGEVKVLSYSGRLHRYAVGNSLCVGDAFREFVIENVRFAKKSPVIKFIDIDDRSAAENMRGAEIYIKESDLEELPEGEFYIRDLIGMKVVDTKGENIGELVNVIQNTAQDIYEVRVGNGRSILIPLVDEIVKNIDATKRLITVDLIEGMMENQF